MNDPFGKAQPPSPEMLREEPPRDRWCDLVLTGGIASGVVYPWAILELARKFRFRNIGGTSVGAMAAAITAASEYARRRGTEHPFEVIRLLPEKLAEMMPAVRRKGEVTTMLSLFQPDTHCTRLFDLFMAAVGAAYEEVLSKGKRRPWWKRSTFRRVSIAVVKGLLCNFGISQLIRNDASRKVAAIPWIVLFVLLIGGSWQLSSNVSTIGLIWYSSFFLIAGFVSNNAWIIGGLIKDVKQGPLSNHLGLCRGLAVKTESDDFRRDGLTDWIHRGVQEAAGLRFEDPPLTFLDLWSAPMHPGGNPTEIDKHSRAADRAINLEMVTTNITHNRPYRLPFADDENRLFFDPCVWKTFFPKSVIDYLIRIAIPYEPKSAEDPIRPPDVEHLLELPTALLPIVVAARLSLSYPLLLSTVPLYAIDYENPDQKSRVLRQCRFSDGGIASNFPVHFFDSALPRWPTFGLWLHRRSPYREDIPVELPRNQDEGRADSWRRFEEFNEAEDEEEVKRAGLPSLSSTPRVRLGILFSFLSDCLNTAKDWNHLTAIRLPHVRRRVARIGLREGEGQLNLSMSSSQILNMAREYGVTAGKKLCDEYAPKDDTDRPTRAWNEHLWIRLQVLLTGSKGLLNGFRYATTSQGYSRETSTLLREAVNHSPVQSRNEDHTISQEQYVHLGKLVEQLVNLDKTLNEKEVYQVDLNPQPELRLRPPL